MTIRGKGNDVDNTNSMVRFWLRNRYCGSYMFRRIYKSRAECSRYVSPKADKAGITYSPKELEEDTILIASVFIIGWAITSLIVGLGVSKAIKCGKQSEIEYCLCGHLLDSHFHYRAGLDCAMCNCSKFHVNLRGKRYG